LLKKTLDVVIHLPSIQKGDLLSLKRLFPKSISAYVLSSLVEAINVFRGLEKYDSLALENISLWGYTTFDICCFRGVTVLAVTTFVKALGICH
jgi:hypothetical protein